MISLGYKKNITFYKTLFAIAIPIVLQQMISASLNLVDNVMIGQLGASNIAAVGLANQVFFLMTLILFGTYSGVSIYIAQYWGNRELGKIKHVMVIGITFGTLVSSLFFGFSFFNSNGILDLFSNDPLVISLGSKYLKIVSMSYILTALSFAYGFSSRSIGRAKLPMYASAISLILNTVLNYALIFGHFGFKAYGIEGAATATLIARIVELSIILFNIYSNSPVLAVKIKDFFDVKRATVKQVFKTAFPVILNETFWALGMTTYAFVYAHIGTDAMASVQISNIINSLFMVASFGLGNASSVMLGNLLGANQIDDAIEYNTRFLVLSALLGITIGILIILLAPLMIHTFFKLTPEVSRITINTMRVMALFMPFKFYSTIIIIGTFRSGGDTLFSMLLEVSCVWLIGVPLAFLGGFVLKYPVYFVVAMVSLEEVTKVILGTPRVISKKWAKRIVM
ncbi:MATE family efflux transporter [Fusibacter ferrireducens]|uniref:MATE family efflux transporter n=1 Tax=Fusibacter ferrireducens TaxID=2785058 RepID=A0ABR9ZVN4_9FIRM|nr:MATE family efflux transporter [Fusibacter ferrireducens]MBF4694051.1 MATE family efflux transporter [Fusibacter ferrireducens]